MSGSIRKRMNGLALMNHIEARDSDGDEQEAFDPTWILSIFTMVQDLFSRFCGGSNTTLGAQIGRMARPKSSDKKRLYRFCKAGAKRKIKKNKNPTGDRVSGAELKQLRSEYADAAYDAFIATGEEASYEERRELALDWRA